VPTTNSFVQRLVGAAALDAAIYEDVEADRSATVQAFIVVLLSSIAGGLGISGLTGGPVNIAFFSMVALLAWCAWALLTYAIGVHMLAEPQTRADVGELMRTIGFASTPGLLRVLGIMTPVAKPVLAVTAVCVIGWTLAIAFAVAFGLMFSPPLS
jgi:hypothetical protein